MAVIDSNSAIFYTGSLKVKRGIEYANLSGTGNAIIPSKAVGLSVNRGAFVETPAYQPLLVSPSATYAFEDDVSLFLGNFTVPDYNVVNIDYNTGDIGLTANTESAAICTTVDPKEISNGDVAAFCLISSTSNQDESVVIRIYATTGGLLFTSQSINIPSNADGVNALASYIISATPLAAGDSVYFTVEGTDNNLTILGSNQPSQIRLERKNL